MLYLDIKGSSALNATAQTCVLAMDRVRAKNRRWCRTHLSDFVRRSFSQGRLYTSYWTVSKTRDCLRWEVAWLWWGGLRRGQADVWARPPDGGSCRLWGGRTNAETLQANHPKVGARSLPARGLGNEDVFGYSYDSLVDGIRIQLQHTTKTLEETVLPSTAERFGKRWSRILRKVKDQKRKEHPVYIVDGPFCAIQFLNAGLFLPEKKRRNRSEYK